MVMPLGPDFSSDLGVDVSHLGLIGGSYTLAAAVSGIASAPFLDRLDRRRALVFAMIGLAFGTALGGFAQGLPSLLLARVVAGACGGPATSMAISIVADVVPPERRGRAMGAVMGAFSAASVLGVPLGLEAARFYGWRMPFFAVAGLGLIVTIVATGMLPPFRTHLDGPPRRFALLPLLRRPVVVGAYLATFMTMGGGFMLIPNISAYVQGNLGYPRDRISLLYLAGGLVSFLGMRIAGRIVDKSGSSLVNAFGALFYAITVWFGFVQFIPGTPIMGIFVAFMLSMSFRNVAFQTLSSKIPAPEERASFASMQSAVQHLASALGAMISTSLLTARGDALVGVERIAIASILAALCVPVVLYLVEKRMDHPQRVSA